MMRSWIVARLVTLARVYFTFLLGWVILRALAGDRWWWLFMFNSLALYLFAPLPVILIVAILGRRRDVWMGLSVSLVAAVYLFGGLFWCKSTALHAAGTSLTVMSYNILGYNENSAAVVAAIRASNADVVTLQELNPLIAEAIQRELTAEYPYQALDPQWGVTGMGTISRYPLRSTGASLPGAWVGAPQVLTLDWDGASVVVLHPHPFATNVDLPARMESTVRERERQAQAIADFVAKRPGPLIAPMDLNASDQSVAYGIVSRVLVDSWREAGWGLGHTFPGAASPGSSRLSIAGVPVIPMWMVRIDYVFHSRHWRAVSAEIGPWDGVSDHRPIVAKLFLARD
jgi:vancomycin resistance protein VanJ